jgi:protein phosphatase
VRIEIPRLALVVLVGAAGSGKSTFARARFKPTQVISSDFCRGLVADDEGDMSATAAAFEVLHLVVSLRLRRGRLTVVDAVNGRAADRRPLLDLAAAHDCPAVALVLDVEADLCVQRDREREGRAVGEAKVRAQCEAVRRSLPDLRDEGFDAVHVLPSVEAAQAAVVRLRPLPVDRRWERGPFDVIGDVHGCLDRLVALLDHLGYRVELGTDGEPVGAAHPAGRRAVLVGDLAGGGPDGPGVLRLVMGMVRAGAALCVRGDRDDELAASLTGDAAGFLAGLPSHLVLVGGTLVVTHAGIRREMQGRDSPRVRRFCLVAEPGWAAAYRGRALVVHGHDPVPSPRWLGRTLDLDTGCCSGGRLSALRHPELELMSLPAQ